MSSSGQRVLRRCVVWLRQVCCDAPAHGADLVAHHAQEALAHGGVQVGKSQHLHRRLKVGQRRAAAFGQAVQHAVALGLLGEVARDVVQHQHEAGQHGASRRPASMRAPAPSARAAAARRACR
jgi:hypothetical protein